MESRPNQTANIRYPMTDKGLKERGPQACMQSQLIELTPFLVFTGRSRTIPHLGTPAFATSSPPRLNICISLTQWC